MSKICVIGNFNIDLILIPVTRLPRWGKEYTVDGMIVRSAGAAGNTSFALAKFGIIPSCVGNVGNDLYGQKILNDLKKYGIDINDIEISPDIATGVGVTLVQHGGGERTFITYLGNLIRFDENLIQRHYGLIEKAEYVLLTGYFLLPGSILSGEKLK